MASMNPLSSCPRAELMLCCPAWPSAPVLTGVSEEEVRQLAAEKAENLEDWEWAEVERCACPTARCKRCASGPPLPKLRCYASLNTALRGILPMLTPKPAGCHTPLQGWPPPPPAAGLAARLAGGHVTLRGRPCFGGVCAQDIHGCRPSWGQRGRARGLPCRRAAGLHVRLALEAVRHCTGVQVYGAAQLGTSFPQMPVCNPCLPQLTLCACMGGVTG